VVLNRGALRWFLAKAVAHLLALAPLAVMVADTMRQALGADPVAELTHRTGDWALRLLLASLAMTPLRRLTGQAWPIRFRRLLGLYAFFYASLHLTVYLVLDLQGFWRQIFDDIVKRPFITVGFTAWVLLLPLALTSTHAAMRWLGRRWALVPRTFSVGAWLGVLAFWWLVKAEVREPAYYAAILALQLAVRAGWAWRTRSAPRHPSAVNKPAAR